MPMTAYDMPARNVEGDEIASSYCVMFTANLKKCEQFLLAGDIKVLQVGRSSRTAGSQATLVSVGWLGEFRRLEYDQLLDVYDGPKVRCVLLGI